MEGNLLMGYQGWFSCPGDGTGTGWFHWFNGDVPDAAHFRVDMFPDASELAPSERCATSLKYLEGDPAYLYSASNPTTVMRHFEWMSQYGIDGVFLQRFLSELALPNFFNQRNTVLDNVRAGAEANGRVFAIEYALSDAQPNPGLVSQVEADWKYLVDVKKVTASPAYLRHKGRPVLAVYGLGLHLYAYTPDQAKQLVDFFENNPDPKYRVTLMGGVPGSWRTLSDDSLTDPGWADYYCSLNIISPWSVGRFSTDSEVDQYKYKMMADMARAKECGAEYMPVVWPGTAFHNTNNPGQGESVFNQIPRRGGELYWRQVYNAVSIGVPMIFNAMFDEVDEDTAMYKTAATSSDQPAGVELLSLDADGEKLPSDWYLRLAGAATKMLRGEIPLTPKIPLNPDGTLAATFVPPEPTPPGQIHVHVQIRTTADWTSFNLLGGAEALGSALVSSSPEATNASADQWPFSLNQPLARAQTGEAVEMVVDVVLSGVQAGRPLSFEIRRGSLGQTTITLMDASAAPPRQVKLVTWSGMVGSAGLNPFDFSVPAESFLPSSP